MSIEIERIGIAGEFAGDTEVVRAEHYREVAAYAGLLKEAALQAVADMRFAANLLADNRITGSGALQLQADALAKVVHLSKNSSPSASDTGAPEADAPGPEAAGVPIGPEPDWNHADMCDTVLGGSCNCYVATRREAWLKGEWPPKAKAVLGVGNDPRDTLRLRWMAETAQLAEDGSDWNETIMDMVRERFNNWRKLPPNDALDAMRKAIDTQVVHEDSGNSQSSEPQYRIRSRCQHGVRIGDGCDKCPAFPVEGSQ